MLDLAARVEAHEGLLREVVQRLDRLEKRPAAHAPGQYGVAPGGCFGQSVSGSALNDRDDLSTFSADTTGMSLPAPFIEQARASLARPGGRQQWEGTAAEGGEQRGNPPERGQAQSSAGGMSDAVTTCLLGLAGCVPLPWLQLLQRTLHPRAAAASCMKADKDDGTKAAGTDAGDQGLQRDQQGAAAEELQGVAAEEQQGAALPCDPSAILAAWPGFSGEAMHGSGTPFPAGGAWGVAACLALAAQCRDDEAARRTVWSNGLERLRPVLAMLQARDSPSGRKAAALLMWHLSRCRGPPLTQAQLAGPMAAALVDCCAGSASDTDVYTVQACALALSNLSGMGDVFHAAIIAAGGPAALFDFLRSSDGVGQEAAATALTQLTASDERICTLVLQEGWTESLVSSLRYGDPRVQEAAAAVLQNLSCIPGSEAALCSAGAVPALLEALRGGSEEAQICALHALGNLAVSESSHPALVLAQGITGVVALCSTRGGYGPLQIAPSPMVREGAIQVLVNLCSGSSATRCALLQQDGAAALLEAASRSLAGLPAAPEAEKGVNYTVPILALTGLTALSADAALAAPLVHQLGAAAPLLQLLLSSGCPPRVRELAAKCVANLSIPDTCKEALVRQGALPLLMLRIRAGSPATCHACCRAVMNLCRSSSARREAAQAGAVPMLLRLLRLLQHTVQPAYEQREGGSGGSKGAAVAKGAPGNSHATPAVATGAPGNSHATHRKRPGALSGADVIVPEAAAGALYNLLSSRAALTQAVRVGGVALVTGAACGCPPSKCQDLLAKLLRKMALHSEAAREELTAMASRAAGRRGAGTVQGAHAHG